MPYMKNLTHYTDTRATGEGRPVFTEVVVKGIAPGGGLFVPSELPAFSLEEILAFSLMPYWRRAAAVFSRFGVDLPADRVDTLMQAAYGGQWDDPRIAPVEEVVAGLHVLELWHGPTSAFKDMALQCMPLFFSEGVELQQQRGELDDDFLILVATSGDTGKAALEGFADRDHTSIVVFYPADGVSDIQRKQMVTQAGDNVGVFGVRGNFDDCQSAVKAAFADEAFNTWLGERNLRLSSANSINWGRLLPQIVYYVSAYADMVASGGVISGAPIDVCVPTGNFGNILAGWYARAMGLPVGRLICASNQNRVLADFFTTGRYDMNRPFYQTISPSMDILLSSNLERLLFELSGRDSAWVASTMAELRVSGRYAVSPAFQAEAEKVFRSGAADDHETMAVIKEVYESAGYLMDPHTAVAWKVLQDVGVERSTVIASTASPYKFAADVLDAITGETADGLAAVARLHALTGLEVPDALAELSSLPERHNRVCEVPAMGEALLQALGG